MKTTVKIEATASAFYNLLIDSVLHDITQATNKKVSVKDIVSGYTYKKELTSKLGKKEKSTVTLTKIESPCCYEANFTNIRGTNTITYHIKELNDDYIEVTYTENYDSPKNQINFKFMNILYQRRNKKKIIQLLKQMELYLQNSKS